MSGMYKYTLESQEYPSHGEHLKFYHYFTLHSHHF